MARVDDKSRGFNMSNLSRSTDTLAPPLRHETSCRPSRLSRLEQYALLTCSEETRLDLRMNPEKGPSAAEWLEAWRDPCDREKRESLVESCCSFPDFPVLCQAASAEEIAWVLREYGDDFQVPTLPPRARPPLHFDDSPY